MNNELDAIHHVAINVPDLEKAIQWYLTSFRCQVSYQDKRLAILEFGNIKLHLILPSEQPAHLAFVRRDARTFGELREQKDGMHSTFVADAAGKPIELIQKE